MRLTGKHRFTAVLALSLFVLVGCKSAEERAEEYFQSGLELMENGDYDRAVIEFRNVFQVNSSHQEARHKLAEIHREHRDNPRAAYSQYLRLVEQYPDDFRARTALVELAFQARLWEDFERHGKAAVDLQPNTPSSEIIAIALDYRAAALEEDSAAMRDHARAAKDKLTTYEDSVILRSLLVDSYMKNSNSSAALAELDWLLQNDPSNEFYWRQRLLVLAQQNDLPAMETQLREMVQRFPENDAHKQSLIRFFMSQDRTDDIEMFLRDLIATADEERATTARVDLIRFLSNTQGPEAARAELDAFIDAGVNVAAFRAMRAGMDFEAGDRDQAIAELRNLIENSEPSDEINNIKAILAKMLQQTGNEVAARALVEDVLADDPGHGESLKMQAGWQLRNDEPDAAIASLRSALDTDADDVEAMTLMAQAYQRAGRNQLAREFLSLAVEASGNAPEETLRYAAVLIEDESYLPAEDLLIKSLRLAPQSIPLLNGLGQIYLRTEDSGRLTQVISALRALETPEAENAANLMEAEKINAEQGMENALGYLEELSQSTDASMTTQINLVQALLRSGNPEAALEKAQSLYDARPDDTSMMALLAATETANGNFEAARSLYQKVLEEDARQPTIWSQLSLLSMREGDPETAEEIIDEALRIMPNEVRLLWVKATYEERKNNIDEAIAIYERLYSTLPNSPIIANNLASMLGTYRQDELSLQRAWTIARRFVDTKIPAIQDTYGWILHRRGLSEEALPYLEAAAAGLPSDPIVQFHLAQIYLTLGVPDKALSQFKAAVEIAGEIDQRRQIQEARAQINTLSTTLEN